MEYEAVLSTDELKKFINQFHELECYRGTETKTEKKGDAIKITLVPDNITAEFLQSSFTDGMLYHWGWHNKFRLLQL